MEHIYYPALEDDSKQVVIEGREYKHLRSLRILQGDKIIITNGRGISAESILLTIDKQSYVFQIEKILSNIGELDYKLALAVGILRDARRFEYALEKAVEIGITDFYPIISQYCEQKIIKKDRLENKAIAAMKQSGRSVLTNIHNPIEINDIEIIAKDFDITVLADSMGESPAKSHTLRSALCLVGPEGGFGNKDIAYFDNIKSLLRWNLGPSRLRTETAAVSILTAASLMLR